MNIKEINNIIETLSLTTRTLEEAFIENGGEVTEETQQLGEQMALLNQLLTTEGVDALGRWLKSKEDEVKTLKAEKDFITRRINSVGNTIDYIKCKLNEVLSATGNDSVKGANGYSFTKTTSKTTTVDKDLLNTFYKDKVEEAIRAARVPYYIGFTLTASASKVEQIGEIFDGDEALFTTTETPTVTFRKPRASK